MQEREASEHGLHCLYQLMDLDQRDRSRIPLHQLLTAAQVTGFSGLNITHPCKQAVIPLLDEVDDDARALGAVNTIVFRDGRRCGYNTDWIAFRNSFLQGLAGAPLNRVVQLGAGGAGAATAYATLHLGAEHLIILDLDRSRAEALADRCQTLFGASRASVGVDPASALSGADGLIHATPTGMAGHPGLPLPVHLLRAELWLAEVVYFPLETELLCAARARGCRTLDGGGMAVWQAAEAFRLFTGLEADASRMRRHFLTLDPVT